MTSSAAAVLRAVGYALIAGAVSCGFVTLASGGFGVGSVTGPIVTAGVVLVFCAQRR